MPGKEADSRILCYISATTNYDRLVLTFNKITNTLKRIQLGTNAVWPYILLGYWGNQGIGAKKYNIMSDSDLCVWLYDYYLTCGIVIGYSSQNWKEVRRKEKRLLAYLAGTCNLFGNISLYSSSLVFELEFLRYVEGDPCYVKSLGALIKGYSQAAERSREVPAVVSWFVT